MNLKKLAMPSAVAAALSIGMVGQASASVYAGSRLLVSDLTVLITEDFGGTNDPSPNATITRFDFTATNTATLNGVSSPVQTATCGGLPGAGGVANNCGAGTPTLNPLPANAPGGTLVRADGDTSFLGPGANQFSNSDSEITTASLVFPGLAPTSPTATEQIAESELQNGTSASSSALITSTTGFTFNFTIEGVGTNALVLSFLADPALIASIIQAPGINFLSGSATAGIDAEFTITQNSTGDAVTWSPQGTATNNCDVDAGLAGAGWACVETADGEDLNRTISVTSDPATATFSNPGPGLSSFGLLVTGLTNGAYSLTGEFTTTTVLTQTVPEPGILALFGIGLAGFGITRRRKQTTA